MFFSERTKSIFKSVTKIADAFDKVFNIGFYFFIIGVSIFEVFETFIKIFKCFINFDESLHAFFIFVDEFFINIGISIVFINGQPFRFTPAWVICYAQPGQGERIAYYIRQQFGTKLNKVDFDVDRYELDCALSIHWDPLADSVTATWVPLPSSTTFDDSTTVFDGNSLKFTAPVDMYTSGDQYDKYLVFPKRNILE